MVGLIAIATRQHFDRCYVTGGLLHDSFMKETIHGGVEWGEEVEDHE